MALIERQDRPMRRRKADLLLVVAVGFAAVLTFPYLSLGIDHSLRKAT